MPIESEADAVSGNLLTQVLGRSEHIHALIKRSAERLSSPEVNGALQKQQAVGELLLEASSALMAMTQRLQIEIRDRVMIDLQLAAAVEQKEGARNAALHDHLTGLPNRALFMDRLEQGIAQAKRHGWTLAVMFVDLDNFKYINDTYGHPAGDAALHTVATRLAKHARTDDTVSRYGGDEFLYLLTPLQEQTDTAVVAAKMLQVIEAPCDVQASDGVVSLRIEASIGISVFPQDGNTAAALIQRADQAMYGAKKTNPDLRLHNKRTVRYRTD